MRSKTVVQLILFITSLVIIFSYIKPAYTNLQSIQVETEKYEGALKSAQNFNTELRNQLSQANALTTTQLQKLDRYLPEDIDTISVMRDIEIIAKQYALEVTGLGVGEEILMGEESSSNTEYFGEDDTFMMEENTSDVLPQASLEFTVKVSGEYEDFKLFLQDLERNAYPLEVTSLTLTPDSAEASQSAAQTASGYAYDLKLQTYKLITEAE